MINTIAEMLSYSFVARAILVGTIVSICAALLGVSLVLKRYAMIGDGLSHVGFGSLTIAVAFGWAPLPICLITSVIASFLLLRISNRKSTINSDSAIALVGNSSLAVGVVIISITTGMSTDVCSYMFGSILAMNKVDIYLSIAVGLLVILLFIFYYRKLFAITFDEEFAVSNGLHVKWYTSLIAVMSSITIVVGMRMLGTLLISSVIIFPALTAMQVVHSFKKVIIVSAIVGFIAFFIGIYISYVCNISTGSSVVTVHLAFFIVASIVKKFIKWR